MPPRSVVVQHQGRLDAQLADMLPEITRSQWQRYIRDGRVKVNQQVPTKTGALVSAGDVVEIALPEISGSGALEPIEVPFSVVYADDDVIVVDKPAGLIVHPGDQNEPETLAHGLLFAFPDLAGLATEMNSKRPGIVHRLDKGTSGIMVVARNEAARRSLIAQFQARTVEKYYDAWVFGQPTGSGAWDGAIGRHPRDRKRFAVVDRGKPAETRYRVAGLGPNSAHIQIQLLTGRTHQIRVHASHAGYPLLGDPVYKRRGRTPSELRDWTPMRGRPALHASRVVFTHPGTEERLDLSVPFPDDLQSLQTKFQPVVPRDAV